MDKGTQATAVYERLAREAADEASRSAEDTRRVFRDVRRLTPPEFRRLIDREKLAR